MGVSEAALSPVVTMGFNTKSWSWSNFWMILGGTPMTLETSIILMVNSFYMCLCVCVCACLSCKLTCQPPTIAIPVGNLMFYRIYHLWIIDVNSGDFYRFFPATGSHDSLQQPHVGQLLWRHLQVNTRDRENNLPWNTPRMGWTDEFCLLTEVLY